VELSLRLPDIRLEIVRDVSPPDQQGFLRVVRRLYRVHYPDGSVSAEFPYDEVDRKAIDAVVIVAHHVPASGVRTVFLRSAVRPPVGMRDPARSPVPALDPPHGVIWELPAGLVEPSEQHPDGPREAARRELEEELGFAVTSAALKELGPSSFPAPGFIAERHFYFEVEVEPGARAEPSLDGSALEAFGEIVEVELEQALELARQGALCDAKTELALRRLRERYP
jgi:ADP-ribose pyrophosphatase